MKFLLFLGCLTLLSGCEQAEQKLFGPSLKQQVSEQDELQLESINAMKAKRAAAKQARAVKATIHQQ
jgi:hypothetical protein